MSLTPAETKATSQELHALRDALPLADAPIESALGYAPGGLQAALDVHALSLIHISEPTRPY